MQPPHIADARPSRVVRGEERYCGRDEVGITVTTPGIDVLD
jgi:hypothetical protein